MATITADPARSALSAGYEGLLELAELVEYPLEPFQKRIARAVVGPEREALILVARGNAKTTLMALVALHELISNPEAKIYFVAASVPQARIAFEAAADFARRLDHPNIVFRHLELRWCPDPEEPTRFTRHMRVLGAEGPRLHGLSPSLMVLDELQAITRADIYPALASALHKTPTSKLITISTAGAGVDTPLGQLRARALGLPDVRRAGARVDCRGRDLRALLWEVPPEASVERMAEVKKANPASWLSSSALREQRGRLADLDFRRFVCNQWASGATSWLPAGAWQSCAGDVGLEDGEKIWVGLDVGGSEADTAVCWVNADLDVGVQVFSGDEGVLHAKDLIEELAERYAVQELAYDPWRARQLALELEQRRIRCIEFAQSAARMCPASEALYRAVVEGRLTHPGDSELDRHVAAAVAKSSPRGWQLAKAPGGGNVDAVIARDGRVARGGAAATTGTTDRLALNGAPLHRLRDVDRRGLPVSAVQLEGEAGLLGRPSTWEALAAAAGGRPDSIAFPRNYKARGRFYAFYTDSVGIRVAELRRSRGTPDRADPASRRILLTVPYVPAAGHFGGQLQVGPDGRLYISIGDGGPQEDPNGRAQDLGSLWGKILRIDPRPSRSRAYRVPASNPFVGRAGARPEIWSYGLRNPWRFSFDLVTGALTIGDVAYNGAEEIDFAPPRTRRGAGANFGWNCFEGRQLTQFGACSPADAVPPVLEYFHSTDACSVVGGYVVRDRALPSLRGRYLYGDLCGGGLRSVRLAVPDATGDKATGMHVGNGLVSFGQDARRRIYAVSILGPVYRVQEAP